MPYPAKFGQPCWTLKQVGKVIPSAATAQTSDDSIPYFLAAHSPFRRITAIHAPDHTLTEEEVFAEIFSPGREQVQTFVTGEPGTGKSHLIRWLRLRAGYATTNHEFDLDKFKLVLVSRGTGSLKDALGQIVHQLGAHFQQHLRRVQTAIDRISDSTARATLLAELALEVDTRWTNEHNRPPLHRSLRNLGQALRSNGFGSWFRRDSGVVHQVIQRLTDKSTVEERESFPCFQPDDFDVPLQHLKPQENSPEVLAFADDLNQEPETRELAAEVLNTALQDAIRALTGLKGTDLLDVFTEIRRELGPDKALAVFIEDVSATSGGLDQDVINAFEPRGGDGLCRMVAVLGIVDSGWEKLAKNRQDRAGMQVYQVGGLTVSSWAQNPEEVAQFTARYLNAVRCTDEEVNAVAENSFSLDAWTSKCNECPHRQPCHATFGKVTLPKGIEIGTFPYTPATAQSILSKLIETRYRSQRGLLTRVLLPVLDQSFDALSQTRFPRPTLFSVQSRGIPRNEWTGFLNRYCADGRWDEETKNRLGFLANYWVNSNTAEELVTALTPFLGPLGLPDFSSKSRVALGEKVETKRKDGGAVQKPVVTLAPAPTSPELERVLSLLDTWKTGAPLQEDNKFRDLLEAFLSKCIVWQDQRGIPIAEKRRLVTGNRFPRIEGQVMRPGGSYFFDFKRDAETYELLESLLLFSHSPNKSWQFEHGELHKRALCRWLRKHKTRVVASVQPLPSSIRQQCLRSAIQALALAALIRDRALLPNDSTDCLKRLFEPVWDPTTKPTVLSSELEGIVADLEQKHSSLREFVVQDLGCGQGEASPKDFIDPLPVMASLDEFKSQLTFDPPPSEAELNYWGPRFVAVRPLRMGAFAAIPSRLLKEHEAIAQALERVGDFIRESNAGGNDPEINLEACLNSLTDVIKFHQDPNILPVPNPAFDNLWQRNLIQSSETRGLWSSAISKAAEVVAQKSSAVLLAFDPAKLKECASVLQVVEKHLELVDKHLKEQEVLTGPTGATRKKLLDELEKIEQLSAPKEKGEAA